VAAWLPKDRRDRLTLLSGVYLVVAVPLAFNQAAHDTAIWEKLAVLHVIVLRFCLAWCFSETRLRRFALDVPALILLAWVAVSWTQAINPMKSGLEVIRVLLAVTLYAAVARTYRLSFLKPWTAALSVTLGVVSIVGIGQYLGFEATEVRSAGYPSATFWYRNFAAMYVISVLPIALARLVFSDSDREATVWSVASGLGMLFLIYTRTRGAWVGLLGALIVATVFWFATRTRRRWSMPNPSAPRQALFATALVIVFVGAAFPPLGEIVGEQMAGAQKTGIGAAAMSIVEGRHSGRLAAWIPTLDLVQDHWVRGVGVGNWDLVYPRYVGKDVIPSGEMFFRPHNDYLWVLSELGIVGALIATWLLIAGLSIGVKCVLALDDTEEGALLLAMLVGIVALGGHAFFSFPKERATTAAIVPLYLGVIAATWHRVGPKADNRRVGPGWLVPVGMTFLCVLALPTVVNATRSFRDYFLADVFFRMGRTRESLDWIESAKRSGIVDARFFEIEGEARKGVGDLEGALTSRLEGLPYHPNNPWSHHAVGVYAQELGRHEEALAALHRAAELAPNLGPILRDLALSTYHTGQIGRAREMYDRAVELAPGDVLTRLEASDFFVATGDTATAHAYLARAEGGIGANSLKLQTLGRHALKAGAWEIAARAFESAYQIKPTVQAALGLADARMNGGQMAAAIKLLGTVRPNVTDPEARRQIDQRLGQWSSLP
jgi:O-antigen ligase